MASSFVSRFCCCFVLCIALGTPGVALAGAFMLPEGQGQFIAGIGYSEGARRFDPSGQAVAVPAARKLEAGGFLEYGLTPELSLVLAPTLDHDYDALPGNSVTGSQSSAFGGRVLLYGVPGRSVALQALVEPMEGGATDVRLMFGQALTVFGWAAFVDAEPGARLGAALNRSEARLDLTVGLRPSEDWLVLLQTFSSFADATGPIDRESDTKLQLSLVHDVSAAWSVQVGAFRTMAGRDALEETGPLLAIWRRF